MTEVDDGVPMPLHERNIRLKLAQSFCADGKIGKSTAAKKSIDELGLWPMVERQSAIDYLRNNIVEK